MLPTTEGLYLAETKDVQHLENSSADFNIQHELTLSEQDRNKF